MKKIKFASSTSIAIAKLLDGERLERILPNLSGNETKEEILAQLNRKREDNASFAFAARWRG
jgi:hypothetical protein